MTLGNGNRFLAPDAEPDKVPMTVEVCLRPDCRARLAEVEAGVRSFLGSLSQVRYREAPLHPPPGEFPFLEASVAEMAVVDLVPGRVAPNKLLLAWDVAWTVHCYHLDAEGPADDDEGEDNVPAYREWVLPAKDFHGAWPALYYDTEIKQRLLRFATSALMFADAGVNTNLIAWNRVVLLHGPPGTGKTSLCKALAQKLTIRLSRRYQQGLLVEVNAHSLFSKWFSESGKLVSRLFSKIGEMVEEPDTLVFVLIDEVESLTAARKAAAAGSEPADAIRALDQLKAHPNVMVLTTSNITEAIDLAFVDRADIKYEILRSCLEELQSTGIVSERMALLPFQQARRQRGCAPAMGPQAGRATQLDEAATVTAADGPATGSSGSSMEEETEEAHSRYLSGCLLEVARQAEGLSGRSLRKLPFLAHAGSDFAGGCAGALPFVNALLAAVQQEKADRSSLTAG
eukprot:scaffold1.g5334.t1